jgi:hypothetical protein
MKLETAIEIGEYRVKDFRPGSDPDERDATKLLIEAGKREKGNRENPRCVVVGYLPGETWSKEANHGNHNELAK